MGAEQSPGIDRGIDVVQFAQRGSPLPEEVHVLTPEDLPGLEEPIILASNLDQKTLSIEEQAAIVHDVARCLRDFLAQRGDRVGERISLAFTLDVPNPLTKFPLEQAGQDPQPSP